MVRKAQNELTGGDEMIVTMLLMVCIIIWLVSKWLIYKLSLMAILLYYGEKGLELPSYSIIQEYRLKAAKKLLGIKLN